MVQEPYNGEEEGMEQFFSPNSQRAPDPVSQDTAAQASQVQPGPSQQNLQTGKTTAAASKGKNPCLVCGKPCTSGTIKCTICSMWCHMPCTKLSKEALKGLEIQAKEVGQAYWACRSCMNFNHKWNALMKETSRRQDMTDSRVERAERNIDELRQLMEDTRREMRNQAAETAGMAERMERMMEEELREREARRLNLVLHGVQEPDAREPKDRMEADRDECEHIFHVMGARVRRHQIRFCRRVGERGQDPRPMVIGLYTEESKRNILERSRYLRNTRYEAVSVVPDLTQSQRKGEQRLRTEAERRNQELTTEDKEKNLKWVVVGSRGEKRLIKGTEREELGNTREGTGGRGGWGAGGRGGGNRGGFGDPGPRRSVQNVEGGGPRNNGQEEPGTGPAGGGGQAEEGRRGERGWGGGGEQGSRGNNTGNNNNQDNSNGTREGRSNYGRGREDQGYNHNNGNYNGNGNGDRRFSNNYNGYNGNNNGSYNRFGNNNGMWDRPSGRGRGNFDSGYGNGRGRGNFDNGYGNGRGFGNGNGFCGDNYLPPTRNNGSEWRPRNNDRPWQETGARRKEGNNYQDSYQENGQDRAPAGNMREDTEEVEWMAGDFPAPIGNNKGRNNSKRNRSWEEEEEGQETRRQRL